MPVLYKQIAYAVIAALFVGGVWWVIHQRARADAAEDRAELAEARADQAEANLLTQIQNAEKAAAASKGYQNELQDLRDRPVNPAPVRLCRGAPQVPGAAHAQPGPAGGAPAAGVVLGATGEDPGPDIGPDLRALLLQCDVLSAQTRGLVGFLKD